MLTFRLAIEQNMPALLTETAVFFVTRNCTILRNKAKVVVADERESGIRAILNLGHTFGHAIETATEYKTRLHGEAVGFGMIMPDLSIRLGLINASVLERTIFHKYVRARQYQRFLGQFAD